MQVVLGCCLLLISFHVIFSTPPPPAPTTTTKWCGNLLLLSWDTRGLERFKCTFYLQLALRLLRSDKLTSRFHVGQTVLLSRVTSDLTFPCRPNSSVVSGDLCYLSGPLSLG